ncbi:MAG: STAS domain-containing protein [Leptospiraceae bacterium]|nr:STAS domain-containing protein [Leptospiraceae bacterium]MDW7975033.1 STAS domain-containing protein [Leptospiraceae bacterium]
MESITKSKDGDVIILKVKGNIQHIDTPNFEKQLEEVLKENNFKIVIDLSNIKHVSSSALGILIAMERKVKRKNGDIRLVITEPEVQRVLQITLLNRIFQIYSNVSDAVESFKMMK